jgi:hypothetical protein
MSDIRTGSIELEDEEIDLADLDRCLRAGSGSRSYQNEQQADNAQQTTPTTQPTI